jgi:adenosylmethionine-8-amino-7-oxononanoate aminotransferase
MSGMWIIKCGYNHKYIAKEMDRTLEENNENAAPELLR